MLKKNNVIKIVWIVNDLYTNNFITIYNECQKNKRFEIKVIASPHIGLNKYNNISSNKVFNFLKKNKVDCINSFENGQYIDISTFNPDYIFTTTPYDIYLPEVYKSHNLKKISKLCNVEYGVPIIKYNKLYSDFIKNNSYYSNTYIFFTSTYQEYLKDITSPYKIAIGCLKLDEYLNYGRDPQIKYNWINSDENKKNNKSLKVIWKPRWTIDKKDSNLMEYINNFYGLILKEKKIALVLLLHPLLESNLKKMGYFEKYKESINKLSLLKNFKIENSSDFLDCVLSSDVLIADHSSTIAEFATTGKPIIYTKTETKLNKLGEKIIATAYQTSNFSEIELIINDILKGIDPLKIKRETAKNSYFTKTPKGLTIAQFLLRILYDDYYNLKSRKEYEVKLYNLNREESLKLKSNIKVLSQNLEKNIFDNSKTIEVNKTLETNIKDLSRNLEKNELKNNKTMIELKKTISGNNDLVKKIKLKNNQIDEIQLKYSKVVNSISWKITKPLRSINKKIKLF